MKYKIFNDLENKYNIKEKDFIESLIKARNEKMLIDIFHKLDKNYQLDYGYSILYYSCFYFENLAHYLIDNGADIFYKRESDCSYFHPLGYSGILSIAKILYEKGLPINEKGRFHYPLFYPIENNKEDLALFLINKGANVNADEFQGMSYLHKVKSKKVCSLLINSGANLNSLNVYKDTPLVYQLRMQSFLTDERKEILIKLIQSGSNLTKSNKFGNNALDYIKRIKDKNGNRIYLFLDQYL